MHLLIGSFDINDEEQSKINGENETLYVLYTQSIHEKKQQHENAVRKMHRSKPMDQPFKIGGGLDASEHPDDQEPHRANELECREAGDRPEDDG
jgi:hypothetical protein